MARSHYLRGRDKEYEVVGDFQSRGYLAQRAASSKGKWDVYCVAPTGVVLVSVKRAQRLDIAKRTYASEKRQLLGLRDALPKEGVAQALWIWCDELPPRGGWYCKEDIA